MGTSRAWRRGLTSLLLLPPAAGTVRAQQPAPVVPLVQPPSAPVEVRSDGPGAPVVPLIPPTVPVRVQEPKKGTQPDPVTGQGKGPGTQPDPITGKGAGTQPDPITGKGAGTQPPPTVGGATPGTGGATPNIAPGGGLTGGPAGAGAAPAAGSGTGVSSGATAAGVPTGTAAASVNPGSAAPTAAQQQAAPAGATASNVTGAGGAAGAATNSPTAGDLLSRSTTATGTVTQRRNPISADPRVRGLRQGQYATVADYGVYGQARQDLDTAIAKFDPGSIQSITVVKGPYSAIYGPGLSFIDIITLGSPRRKDGEPMFAGRTSGTFQTNGRQWDGLQSVEVRDTNWGFRGTYNILQGNDYESGDGTRVPSSYLSNNINFALGVDLSRTQHLEFKGLKVIQNDLEFPGLYFDISRADTEAYSLRYTLEDQGFLDKLTLDVWYNVTTASGDTTHAAKQAFVQKLLGVSFNPVFGTGPGQVRPSVRFVDNGVLRLNGFENPNVDPRRTPRAADGRLLANEQELLDQAARANGGSLNLFQDNSNTRFAGRSIGYRLAASWAGPDGDKTDPWLTLGTDLNAFGQGLVESINLRQIAGTNLNTGLRVDPAAPVDLQQTQRIPESNQVTPGLFVQSKLPVTDRWTVRSGGRLDFVHSSSNPRLITGNIDLFGPFAFQPPPNIDRFNLDPLIYSSDPTDPRLTRTATLLAGFMQNEYKLDDNWTALLAFGHAERAPTLTEYYAAGPFIGVLQQGTSRLVGDPNLRKEKLTQLDLGVRAEYEFFQAGGNLFYAWVDDFITYDANRLAPGLTQVVFTNTDRATLAGAELFASMDVTPWLTPFGTLSYVQGTDETATDRRRTTNLDSSRRDDPVRGRRKTGSEPLPQIPPLDSRAGLRFKQPGTRPAWQVEFSARMVAGQNRTADSLGELATGGFTVFNVRGFWRVSEQLLVSAGVENFGDRNYREHLDPISGNLLGSGPLLRPGTNFFFNTQFSY